MSEQQYSLLALLRGVDPGTRSPFCPDDQLIADYSDGGCRSPERAQLQNHFAECRYCRARIGIIARTKKATAGMRVPEGVLAQAKQLAPARRGRRDRRPMAWAAAAMVSLGAFLVFEASRDALPGGSDSFPTPEVPTVTERSLRAVEPLASRVQVHFPGPSMAIPLKSSIRWQDYPGATHYDLLILSAAGDVITTERTQATRWALDPALPLEDGATYYVRILANLSDGRAVSSPHVEFRVEDRR